MNLQRVLIGGRFENVRVELGWPSHESNPNCYPCLFLQFLEPESRGSKMLQIFSKQAPMMDALVTRFHRARCRAQMEDETDNLVNQPLESSEIDGGK